MVRSRKNPENNAIHVNLHMGRMLEKYLFMQRNLGAFLPALMNRVLCAMMSFVGESALCSVCTFPHMT